jgi:hypothetical protein
LRSQFPPFSQRSRAPRRTGRPALPLVLCLIALACAGCRLQLQLDVEVNRNGGGVLAAAVSADSELIALADQAGADPLADLVAAGESLEGWTVEDNTGEAGSRTVTLSAPFADPEQFEALTTQLSGALNAEDATLLEPLTLAVTDDEIRVAGAAAAQPERAVRDFGLSRREVVRRLRRTDAFAYDVVVTLPGEVTSSNATAVAGREAAWEVPVGRRVDIAAAGVRPGPPILRAVAGAAAGAVVAGLVVWLLARRSRRRPG